MAMRKANVTMRQLQNKTAKSLEAKGADQYVVAIIKSEEYGKLTAKNVADGITLVDAMKLAFSECQHNMYLRIKKAMENPEFLSAMAIRVYGRILSEMGKPL